MTISYESLSHATDPLPSQRMTLATGGDCWLVNRRQSAAEIDAAAAELVDYIGRCTGARIEMGSGDNRRGSPGSPVIHLGRDAWVEQLIPDLADLDDDGFAIETIDAWNLVIAGPSSRATGYGVLEFIETVLGVRWLFPGPLGEYIPQLAPLPLPEIHIRREPAFASRTQPGLSSPAQMQWGCRQRLHERLCGATHSLHSIFAPEKYALSHPEFFPVVNGKRYLDPGGWDWHPCFCAEGLAEEAARLAVEYFRDHPQERCFSIAISDGAVHCECARCADAEKGRRNWLGMRHVSEQYFRWANRVAELVAAEFPDRYLGSLGYANLFDPPSEVELHPNLVVFHTYDRHKWVHPALERDGHQLTEDWRAVCNHLAWYDYTFGASFYIPRIYFQRMATNYRYAKEIGVEGITAETCHNWAEAPKYYLLARLQWDPDIDADAVLAEWYALAVGERAAPYLARYYDYWESIWADRMLSSRAFSLRAQQWLPIQDDSYMDILRPEDFSESRELLQQTVNEAGSDIERERARLLLRGFSFYEAVAACRLPDWQAGRSSVTGAADAIASIEQAVVATAGAASSYAIDESLAEDEVLQRITVPFWNGVDRRFWGIYPLWRVFEWVAANTEVRGAVERLADSAGDLGRCAHSLLQMVDGELHSLVDLSMRDEVEIRTVGDATRRAKEPGEDMDSRRWQLTVGNDVEPFWNPPHGGRSGRMRCDATGGRSGRGAIFCEGTGYGTVRRRLAPIEALVTALCFVRMSAPTSAQVELRLWQICWTGHNPSPYRTTVCPQAGEYMPVAVTADLKSFAGRRLDYLLLEIVVQGLEAGEILEISDVAIWLGAKATPSGWESPRAVPPAAWCDRS